MSNIYYIDGFTVGSNPCTKGGFSIADKDGNIEYQYFVKSREGKEITNNYTEFLGLYFCLTKAEPNSIIYTDSMNNISWSRGKMNKKSKRKDLAPLARQVHNLLVGKNITLVWIGRDSNLAGISNDDNSSFGWHNVPLPELYIEDYTFQPDQQSLF
jgi:ribonuclease HI